MKYCNHKDFTDHGGRRAEIVESPAVAGWNLIWGLQCLSMFLSLRITDFRSNSSASCKNRTKNLNWL